MANIFKQQKDLNNKPKRNNFDLSFQNHLSLQMGVLYPVFCKEVVPGDSLRINSAFGLKFMPLAFPVQSKMRAVMHFFYVRNKNLWNRWEDWISGLKTADDGVVHPYISQPRNFFRTGSLADYLNVPTTYANTIDSVFAFRFDSSSAHVLNYREDGSIINVAVGDGANGIRVANPSWIPYLLNDIDGTSTWFFDINNPFGRPYSSTSYATFVSDSPTKISLPAGAEFRFTYFGIDSFDDLNIGILHELEDGERYLVYKESARSSVTFDSGHLVLRPSSQFVETWNSFAVLRSSASKGVRLILQFAQNKTFRPIGNSYPAGILGIYTSDIISSAVVTTEGYETPFSRDVDQIRISALPFRAYESIYNAYYRNSVNQPFRINGQIEYNKYNTTTDGGPDSTDYHLCKRNYELDFLTSALPSPQQGNAPLVGMNALGQITLESEDGVTTAQAVIDESTGEITGLNVTSPIANKEHALTLQQIASAGFTINSFRDTNALTRWLETNIRKGYRYLDFISGHFGKSPKYSELDMPEFIGGYSRDVNVSQIISTADTLGLGDGGQGLGNFQGNANCFGGSNHSITHYCDDYGFIIGIMCVVPTPAYSQLLPKHYLKYSPLDYYFPEFSQLGMQPITYEEVCPIQAYYQGLQDGSSVHDTFGYQRPNYDLVSNVDELHGAFRGDLRNFLINRVFGSRPVLGNDFLQIDPDETKQIFVDQNDDAQEIIGQIIFDVKAKRPVPRVVIPSLGR